MFARNSLFGLTDRVRYIDCQVYTNASNSYTIDTSYNNWRADGSRFNKPVTARNISSNNIYSISVFKISDLDKLSLDISPPRSDSLIQNLTLNGLIKVTGFNSVTKVVTLSGVPFTSNLPIAIVFSNVDIAYLPKLLTQHSVRKTKIENIIQYTGEGSAPTGGGGGSRPIQGNVAELVEGSTVSQYRKEYSSAERTSLTKVVRQRFTLDSEGYIVVSSITEAEIPMYSAGSHSVDDEVFFEDNVYRKITTGTAVDITNTSIWDNILTLLD